MAENEKEEPRSQDEGDTSSSKLSEAALNDDLLAIEVENDTQLELSDNYGVFDQEAGMIAWSLQNFYREDGTIRSKRELKLDPAILRIEDASGGSVDFVLTKEFTKTLNDSLEVVRLASYGIHKSKKPFDSFKEALVNSAIENPIRTVLLGVIVVLVPVFLFLP